MACACWRAFRSHVPIDTIIVDDHAVVREGIARLLGGQLSIRVLADFGDSRTALAFALRTPPDVAIVDIEMRGLNGIELVRQLHERCPRVRSLIFSMHADEHYVRHAFDAGATGYLLKEAAGNELITAVHAVHQQRRYIGRKLRKGSRGLDLPQAVAEDRLSALSRREREVLQLVAEGMTSAAIALLLGISAKSVETYRSRLMHKVGCGSVAALVKYAIRNGITGLR